MKPFDRRTFLAGGVAGLLAGLEIPASAQNVSGQEAQTPGEASARPAASHAAAVDFCYAPSDFQCTICFPDDPYKTVVGKHGDLRYDFPADHLAGINQFGSVVEFALAGMGEAIWRRQYMESPGTPIVHTRFDRNGVELELVAFATRNDGEGRVDNVLMEIRPREQEVIAAPLVKIRSRAKYRFDQADNGVSSIFRETQDQPWLLCIPQSSFKSNNDLAWRVTEAGYELYLEHGVAQPHRPMQVLFRFPQGANEGKLKTDVSPETLLTDVQSWWRQWQAFAGDVEWSLPGVNGEFLTACARNIQQAREVRNGSLVFEVGPTVYRGMWIVDGNFLLEAARYLGYDEAADQGLLAEWNQQNPSGQISASAGKEHWKDTAIAIFTLVRACELKQDWTLLRQLAPKVGHAVEFLIGLRDEARKGDSPNGRYGLLAPGFPDGGIGGVHYEFTNTLWALAGLRAAMQANERLQLSDLNRVASFYRELKAALDRAAADEMVADPRGFRYLPMLMREDPAMRDNNWDRPRPQSAQWALSHTIFPGQVFPKDHLIVRGHIELMRACTQEDIPAETGWLRHQAVWNYNAAFAAQVYLWAGEYDWAHRTFQGYLNHASPLHVWREEQPLQHALVGMQWGDMPHNWASAECVRYLRHMLVLEDERKLRLLEGLAASDLLERRRFAVQSTPTRFGRVSLAMEPVGRRDWKLRFVRREGSEPATVEMRASLAPGLALSDVQGAAFHKTPTGVAVIDPSVREWTASWTA